MSDIHDQLLAETLRSLDELDTSRDAGQSIERALMATMGGQPYPDALSGPDIWINRIDGSPIGVEVKYFRSSVSKNLQNVISALTASAVEVRRSYRGDVTLSAVLLFSGMRPAEQRMADRAALERSDAIRRLLRSGNSVGYDSVLFGYTTDEEWELYEPALSTDRSTLRRERLRPTVALARLRNQEGAEAKGESAPAKSRQLRLLLVADEWRSGHGGLSTLNRELAIALAAADLGIDVAVMVPTATDEDARAAAESNVALVTPARIPGLEDRELLLLRPLFADPAWLPDVIVGHGRVLGPYAVAQQQQYFPEARRVHFVHTDAEQLESAKEFPLGESNMITADHRKRVERDLARSADLVVGVGPLLAETMREDLMGPGPASKIISLVPGLRDTFDTSALDRVRNRILIIGRADDFRSKGIDIAAEAVLQVIDHWGPQLNQPSLIIRGIPDHAKETVKARLDDIFEDRLTPILRPYSSSEEDVIQDMSQARVVLMPSRHEGFGLAAFEAIASGVPVLVSAESGLAQFLRESGIDTQPSPILSTHNSGAELAVTRWRDAILTTLREPDRSRRNAVSLREQIVRVTSWPDAAKTLLAALEQ